jgi:hypothetical protein
MNGFGRRTAVLEHNDRAFNLSTPYRAVALYLKDSDCIEYVREDVPRIHRRVDEFLTLVIDMRERNVIGFCLKGFRHFYLNEIKTAPHHSDESFVAAVSVLESAMTKIGGQFDEKLDAYRRAREIAWQDHVELTDLPEAA